MLGGIRRGDRGGLRDWDPQPPWCPGVGWGSQSCLLDAAAAARDWLLGDRGQLLGRALGRMAWGRSLARRGPQGGWLGGWSWQDSGEAGGGRAGGVAGSRHQLS